MSLRERSKQVAEKLSAGNQASERREGKPHLSLLERAQEILRRAADVLSPEEVPGNKAKRPSLRERALAFLKGEKPLPAVSQEEKPHKGLLQRAKELLGLAKAEETGEDSEKKNPEILPDSSSEPEVLELAAAPEPGDEPLEHLVGEEPPPEPVDPHLTEKIGEFFDKLASAIENLDYTLRDRLEETTSEEPREEREEKVPESKFFDDEQLARPRRGLRPVLANFLRENIYLEDYVVPKEEIPPSPQIIIPEKQPFERRNPQDPLPLQLTYRLNEIIPPGSPYEFHARALSNAEHYLEQGQFRDAIHILERVAARVEDKNIRHKIEKNIQDIEEYLKKEEERVRSLPVLPQYTPEWFHPSEKMEQRIEQAQFAIEQAGMQAASIQIVTQAPVEPAPGLPASMAAAPGAVTTQPAAAMGVGVAGTPTDHTPTASAEVLPVEGAPVVAGGGAAVPVLSEETPAPAMAPLPPDEEKAQGVLQQPAIPPLATGGENLDEGFEPEPEKEEKKEEKAPVQEIRGVLELKPPDEEDTPFLTLSYDFDKIPHQFVLSRDHQIFEYAYYKYKPMLVKAQKYIRRKQITKALNYYRVIREQQIPAEFRRMIDRNIKDITEYLQKYLMARQ